MRKILYFIIVILLGIATLSQGQEILVDYNPVNKLKLYYEDYYIQFEFSIEEKPEIEIEKKLYYFWYKENNIRKTQGGYDGKLLQGIYTKFFNSGMLMEKGQFSYGLKSGEWKKWYDDGNLYEVGNWKNGLKAGNWVQYNTNGMMTLEASYKNGKLHGDYCEYMDGELLQRVKYKNGKVTKDKKSKKRKDKKPEQGEEDTEKENNAESQ